MHRVARAVALVLASIACLLGPASSLSQDFPSKPIRLIVADSPGASWDIVARLLAPDLSRLLGQPIVVENRPGGSYTIGLGFVAKQVPADGYTVAIAAIPGLAILPLTMKDLRFDPLKDLQAVVTLVEGRIALGTSSQFPWKNFDEMIAQARAAPGKLNYGSSGANSRLQMEAIVRASGVDIVFVPYKAGSVYLQGLVTGEVQMGILSEVSAGSYGDKMRVLAVTGERRSPHFPDVPTFAEIGRPEIRGTGYVLAAPAGVNREIIEKLNNAASRALSLPELKARLAKIRLDVIGDTPDGAAKRIAEESRLFADIARKIGFQPE